MFKTLTVFFFLRRAAAHRPGEYYWVADDNYLQFYHLINMTESLCKDAMYKLRMADVIQTNYKGNLGYNLGIIAAGLMEKFRHMLRTYRYYSNHKSFKNEDHEVADIMNAYSVMQGDYNELVAETVLYHKVIEDHDKKNRAELEDARVLAKKHRMSVSAIMNFKKRGIKLSDIFRRSMQNETKEPELKRLEENGDKLFQLLLEDPMAPYINTWTPKKKDVNKQEEEYKKKLRYTKWAEKWNGFDGDIEGVHIADTIAKLRLNDSNFLLKELKGPV